MSPGQGNQQADAPDQDGGSAWPALASRNFRLYVCGQAASLSGTFMQSVALGWLVYRLTGSEFMLGLVGFVGELPGVVVALLAGVLADRVNPYRIVFATQALAMLQALVLAALVLTGHASIAAVLVLACLLGLVNGFDVPARQVLVTRLVDGKRALQNAITINSMTMDIARLIGPALGGAAIAAFGEGSCFLLNAASFAVVLVALKLMRLPPLAATGGGTRLHVALRAGISHAAGSAPIRAILFLVAAIAFAGSAASVLMPAMARSVLMGGPATLGLLTASSGVGAIAGALFLAFSRQRRPAYWRLMGGGGALFGAGLVAFSASRSLPLSCALLAVAGFGIMIMMNLAHTRLLYLSDPDKQGRVMSLFTLSFMASAPLGSLCNGLIAERIGAAPAIAIGGGLCMLAGLIFAAMARAGKPAAPDR